MPPPGGGTLHLILGLWAHSPRWPCPNGSGCVVFKASDLFQPPDWAERASQLLFQLCLAKNNFFRACQLPQLCNPLGS